MKSPGATEIVHRGRRRAGIGRRGFTLVEVLVTMMMLAIVIPVIMKGISVASAAADDARHRTEAAALGGSRLSQIVAGQQWQNGNLSGDFSPNWPDYHWQATVVAWPGDQTGLGIEEVDLNVLWSARGRQNNVKLSTLVYPVTQAQ